MQPTPSPLSERLANVRVGTRAELEVSRHLLNGRPAYVVRDPISFQTLRMSAEDYQIFVAITPDLELCAILANLIAAGTLASDQAEQFYGFVLRLTQLGLLTLPVSDGSSLYKRFRTRRLAELKSKALGFLFLRVPLISPDGFLNRTRHVFEPLFSKAALLLWTIGLLLAGMLVYARWDEFVDPLGTVTATSNLPALWTLLVVLKIFHEFGHAYACRKFGGTVPEMGAYFIAFTPCAYMDASSCWGFPNRWHRIVVALAGMYFESIIAMLALLVWCVTPAGQIHSIAQYTVLLSTVVTIGFNANPLMKYDGYYVLSDLMGMPNLRADAQRAWLGLLKRIFFGIRPAQTDYEPHTRILLVAFGLLSTLYKFVVVIGISLMLAFMVPALGIGLAGFYVLQTLQQSFSSLLRLVRSESAAPVRGRVLAVTGACVVGVVAAFSLLPVPGSVNVTGTLKRSEDFIIRAQTSGFLVTPAVSASQDVLAGDVVCELQNVDLHHQVAAKQAEIIQNRIRLQQSLLENPVAAAEFDNLIRRNQGELEVMQERCRRLQVRTSGSGLVTEADALRRPGRYVREGDALATVSAGRWQIDSLMAAEDLFASAPSIDQTVDVCIAGQPDSRCRATIVQVARAGSRVIEQESLTHRGGGDIPVEAATREAAQPFFKVTVELDDAASTKLVHGMTAVIRFSPEPVPVGLYLYRRGLQLLNKLRLAG